MVYFGVAFRIAHDLNMLISTLHCQTPELRQLTPQKNTCRSMLVGQDRVDTFLTKIIATNLQL